MEDSHWIEHAVKHAGALKSKAEGAGMSTHAYAEKHQHEDGVTGHQARLGLTLMSMHAQGKHHDADGDMDGDKKGGVGGTGMHYSTEHMPKGD